MQRSAKPTDTDQAEALARSELVGRRTRIAGSNDPTLTGLEGTVVDETMKTLTIQTGTERRVVGKLGQRFAFLTDDREVLLAGREIAHRPEDRIKKAKVDR